MADRQCKNRLTHTPESYDNGVSATLDTLPVLGLLDSTAGDPFSAELVDPMVEEAELSFGPRPEAASMGSPANPEVSDGAPTANPAGPRVKLSKQQHWGLPLMMARADPRVREPKI
jgi:hypothetical protein